MDGSGSIVLGLGIGLALAGAPGPVQAVLLAEAMRGGVGRGLRALAGASLTFGSLLVALALGLSVVPPEGTLLRGLRVVGGLMLLWLALDAIRADWDPGIPVDQHRARPFARGSLAILLNPGAWLFLAAVASPLIASAERQGGTANAVFGGLALMGGAAIGDLVIVVIGAAGIRRAPPGVGRRIKTTLAVVLAALGTLLLVNGIADTS